MAQSTKLQMDRLSREDLIKEYDDVSDTLERYKKRFKDLFHAHKRVVSEKETLEKTISAFQSSTPVGANTSDNACDDCKGLKEKTNTLIQSLNVLSEEKTKMNNMYLSDKRELREELHKRENELSTQITALLQQQERLRERNRELVAKCKELSPTGNGADPRQLSELQKQAVNAQRLLSDKKMECEVLSEENYTLKQLLGQRAQNEEESNFRVSTISEGSTTNDRVSSLEQQLRELSAMAGQYETSSFQDKQLIKELEFQLQDLMAENEELKTELASTSVAQVPVAEVPVTALDAADRQMDKFLYEIEFLQGKIAQLEKANVEKQDVRVADLHIKLKYSEKQVAELQQKLRLNSEEHTLVINQFKGEISTINEQHQKSLALFEAELQLHKKRTALLLLDNDIDRSTPLQEDGVEKQHTSEPISTNSPRLRPQSPPQSGCGGEAHSIFVCQQLSQLHSQLSQLRHDKFQLSGDYRRLQHESSARLEELQSALTSMQKKVTAVQRQAANAPDYTNHTYLRHITLCHLISTETIIRQQTLNAISTVLNFTDEEKKKCLKRIK